MKKILNFYLKAFLVISFISIPFIFIAFPDLKKNEFTYRIWISTFFPQLLYIVYAIKTNNLYQLFKANFTNKFFYISLIVLSFSMPFIVYFSLIGFRLIEVTDYYNWNIDLIYYFIMIFLSAFLEEILFRFIPYTLLGDDITIRKVILISLVFSIFHVFNPNITVIGILNIILAGIFFSIIYLKSNSVFLVTIIHAFWNFSMGCIFGSNISGAKIISVLKYIPKEPYVLSGGEFGFEGSIITTIIFLAFSAILYNLKTNSLFRSA